MSLNKSLNQCSKLSVEKLGKAVHFVANLEKYTQKLYNEECSHAQSFGGDSDLVDTCKSTYVSLPAQEENNLLTYVTGFCTQPTAYALLD